MIYYFETQPINGAHALSPYRPDTTFRRLHRSPVCRVPSLPSARCPVSPVNPSTSRASRSPTRTQPGPRSTVNLAREPRHRARLPSQATRSSQRDGSSGCSPETTPAARCRGCRLATAKECSLQTLCDAARPFDSFRSTARCRFVQVGQYFR